jgi:mannose-1-phosphate guanylyltransferase
MTTDNTVNTWALVLAAGEGSRLRSLTTTRNGFAVPKQFCSLHGGPSLLQEALHRAETVPPRARICTIVAAQHRRYWEGQLRSLPPQNVIVQPENRGTANGLLLPLLHITARDPNARVVILPSDHHVLDEPTLTRALRQAAAHVAHNPASVWLLGIAPDEPDPELGYIVPGLRDEHGALGVAKFVEKPTTTLARALIERGAMWNAFILAASVKALIDMFRRRYPHIVSDMRRAAQLDLENPRNANATAGYYARVPELDFSRHVLEGAEPLLRIQPVPPCGWSDLGTPKRVSEALRRLEHDRSEPACFSSALLSLAAQHARLQAAT